MVKICFIRSDGSEKVVGADVGGSVMDAARMNNIPGIEAECGGACSCATCHIYVDPGWRDRVGEASTIETEMLELALGVRDESRLACQIDVTPDLDGLIVRIPDKQG